MCLAPRTLETGVVIPCHNCKQCRLNAIYDWVGRNIAESKTSVASHVINLTYGRGEHGEVLHPRAVLLTYRDVQLWLKLWRKDGFPLRYFVSGEFGSEFSRAHWHVVVHWQERVPKLVLEKRYNEGHWPHGFSYVQAADLRGIRYAAKYIQKAQAPREGIHVNEPPRMSKKPPLGARYFEQLAAKLVEQGLSPQDLRYTFPGVTTRAKNGETRPTYFRLAERSAELFLDAYLRLWKQAHGNAEYPHSDLLRLYESYGRIIYDEENVGKVYEVRDNGNRLTNRFRLVPPVVPDRVREEQAAEIESRYPYPNRFRWLDEGDVERELERRGL